MGAWSPDATALYFYGQIAQALQLGWDEVFSKPSTSPLERALRALTLRTLNSWNSVSCLVLHGTHDSRLDCCAILRAAFDTYLQAAWIGVEESSQTQRAELYLDFLWVERSDLVGRIVPMQNSLGRRIAESPDREAGETLNRDNLERVRSKYANKHNRLRSTWYPGSLRDLARDLGKLDEYQVFVHRHHGAVHSNPMATTQAPIAPPHAVFQAAFIASRTLVSTADALGICLSRDVDMVLRDLASRDVLEAVPARVQTADTGKNRQPPTS